MASPARSEPAYSIGVTAKLTGVPIETLRAWERRYGSPRPRRHPGGHRTYDEREVERLRLVARAIDAGHRAREVVALSASALERLSTPPTFEEEPLTSDHESVRRRCVDAIRGDDVLALARELRAAAMLLGPLAFVTNVAHPLAVEVGRLWEEGELDIRQEHLFTASLSTQLRVLLAMIEPTSSGPTVLLATFPEELHALGLEMVAVHIATRGGAPRLLGASLPPREIAKAASALRANAIGISVSGVQARNSTVRHVRALLDETKRLPLWLGGAGATSLGLRHARVRTIEGWPTLDEALREKQA